MIKLYHGSNTKIEKIDLSKSRKGKDFGKGFYLNADREQAYEMAKRTAQRLSCGEPTLNIYVFDETIINSPGDMKVKIFDDYSIEWAEFVLKNRANKTDNQIHPYDIVIGPIADDTVGVQIWRYTMGYIDIESLIKELKYKANKAVQYFFGSNRAIELLKSTDNG